MISVVMSTYNGEHFLREQLDSIWNQTRKPDEIIINDDGSSDATQEIIYSYIERAEMPIKFFLNKERLGYASNFRKAMLQAKGDIVILSDQDDIWDKRKIEICERFFATHEDALALSTAYQVIDECGRTNKKGIFYKNFSLRKVKKISWKAFLRYPKYPGMTMAVRKVLINEIEFNADWKNVPHDWQLNQEASYRNGMYFLNIPLTQYRQHQSNTVGTLINMTNERARSIREKMLEDMYNSLKMIVSTRKKEKTYIKRNIIYQIKRKELYKKNKYVSLFFYSILNLNYISIRSILGDLYTGLQYSRSIKR